MLPAVRAADRTLARLVGAKFISNDSIDDFADLMVAAGDPAKKAAALVKAHELANKYHAIAYKELGPDDPGTKALEDLETAIFNDQMDWHLGRDQGASR